MSGDAYTNEVAPQLDLLATNWLPVLKQDLAVRLRAMTYGMLKARHDAREPITYCGWINADKKDGRTNMLPLIAGLLAGCRTTAPEIVTGLLNRHADNLDLSLAVLPTLDTSYPGWFTADLGDADRGNAAALNPLDTRRSYIDRLGTRLQAAEPGLERQLDAVYTHRTWSGERLTAPADDCRAQLGPLQAGSVGAAEYEPVRRVLTTRRLAEARAWLVATLPKLQAAFPQALATLLPSNGPLRSPGWLCSNVVGGWLGQGDYPTEFRQPVEARCIDEAVAVTAAAVAARVGLLAAPLLSLPHTLEMLKEHVWFGLTGAQLRPLTLPDDAERDGLLAQTVMAFAARVGPAAVAAVDDGKTRIAAAYAQAAGSAEAFREVLRLCGPDGTGAQLPPAGRGGEIYRDQILAVCAARHQALPGARVDLAQARSGVGGQLTHPAADAVRGRRGRRVVPGPGRAGRARWRPAAD